MILERPPVRGDAHWRLARSNDEKFMDPRKLARFLAAYGPLNAGCEAYGVSLARAFASSVYLYAREKFSLKEITGYALYAPEIRETLPILISKERSLAKLAAMNPRERQEETEDKAVFYGKCQAAGLPIPRCYGVFQDGRGTDGAGNPRQGRDDWSAWFSECLPTDFIIKDLGGAYASGFAAFRRCGDRIQRLGGGTTDIAGFYDELSGRAPAAFILQERLFDHPDLEALSGCRGLQTMRVNTELTADGDVSLLFYWLKIRVAKNVADNFSMGTVGNLAGFGNSNEGVLVGARTRHPCGSGLITIGVHPETQTSLDGYRIPMWHDAVHLAKSAHRTFSAFGILGWDIAITEHGPKIIEANAWWDPPLFVPQVMSPNNWRRIFG